MWRMSNPAAARRRAGMGAFRDGGPADAHIVHIVAVPGEKLSMRDWPGVAAVAAGAALAAIQRVAT